MTNSRMYFEKKRTAWAVFSRDDSYQDWIFHSAHFSKERAMYFARVIADERESSPQTVVRKIEFDFSGREPKAPSFYGRKKD